MSETSITPDVAPVPAPAPPVADLAQMSSVSDYRAVRESLVRESAERAPGDVPVGVEAPTAAGASAAEPQTDTEETPAEAEARERDDQGRFRKKNPQNRIDRVVWEREQARQEAAQLRSQLDAMRQRPATPEAPQATPPSGYAQDAAEQEPRAEHYSDYASFVSDQARWAARQEFRALQAREQQQWATQQAERAMQTRASTFADRLDKATETDPELLADIAPEVLSLRPAMSLRQGEQPTGATAIADALLESDVPHMLMRHLSDHPDDLRRITALHPMLAMREIGRIEARLDTASSGPVPAPSVSQAKPPIQPVGRSAAVPGGQRDPSQINSVAEWNAYKGRLTAGAR